LKVAFRQAVISIYSVIENAPGQYYTEPTFDVIFRQPYHNLGLALSFNFTKTFDSPFSTCNLIIHNPSQGLVNSMKFSNLSAEGRALRPKIEIRAGESEYKLKDIGLVNELKRDLSLIYSGYPIYFQDRKIIGGRQLEIQLSDVTPISTITRITQVFPTGMYIVDVLKKLETLAGESWTLNELQIDREFGFKKLAHDLTYMALNVHSQILPALSRIYGFIYNRDAIGNLVFSPSNTLTQGTSKGDISNRNGLIEYPVQVNWDKWHIKTFFGRPFILYPYDRFTVEASNLDSKVMDCLVTEANYNFNDSSAEIIYLVSPTGNVSPLVNPIIQA